MWTWEKIAVILAVVVISVKFLSAEASEAAYLENATELYTIEEDLFVGGALIYRPQCDPEVTYHCEADGLRLFDMKNATVTIIKYGPPENCVKLLITTADGLLRSECVADRFNKVPPVKYNGYGEVEDVDPEDIED